VSFVVTPVEELKQSDVVLVVLRRERARSGVVFAPTTNGKLAVRMDGRIVSVPVEQIMLVKRRRS
jgi:chaperone required for assembly of F1-ATPase